MLDEIANVSRTIKRHKEKDEKLNQKLNDHLSSIESNTHFSRLRNEGVLKNVNNKAPQSRERINNYFLKTMHKSGKMSLTKDKKDQFDATSSLLQQKQKHLETDIEDRDD